MNKKNYNKIVKLTNFFFNCLVKNKINLVKYCDFFYVLNAHPLNLKKYFFFKSSQYNFFFFFKLFTESVKNILYIFYRFLDKNYFYSININKKVDIIFFSHLINFSHLNNNDDFYFGNLPKLLNKSSITVLSNQTELSNSQLIQKKIIIKKILSYYRNMSVLKMN